MKEFHRRDFANRTGLAQAWTVKSADRLFTVFPFAFDSNFWAELFLDVLELLGFVLVKLIQQL